RPATCAGPWRRASWTPVPRGRSWARSSPADIPDAPALTRPPCSSPSAWRPRTWRRPWPSTRWPRNKTRARSSPCPRARRSTCPGPRRRRRPAPYPTPSRGRNMSDTTNGPVPMNPLTFGPVTVSAGDPRYESLVVENYNHRFVGKPDYIRLVGTTEQVVDAVGEAVANGRRIAVRSGRHCFEDFTSSPHVEVLLGLSPMSNVYFDAQRGAFAIEAGATLGHVYRTLFSGWGVTIPGGTCFDVGAGGHITGGGYGHLSRRHGLVVDHLDAVEVVVVDATGRARAVVATRDPDDPNHDLWWASAGGGGGNFGVWTGFWMPPPGAGSTDPADLLPKAPTAMRRNIVMWPWEPMTEASWTRLVRNYCTWFENNSAPNSPYANLWTDFIITHRVSGKF